LSRALKINDKALGPEHPETAKTLRRLDEFHSRQGSFYKADPFLRQAFRIAQKFPEDGNLKIADFAKSYFNVLRKVGRNHEAQKLRARFLLGQ